jgi:hypothetical protein
VFINVILSVLVGFIFGDMAAQDMVAMQLRIEGIQKSVASVAQKTAFMEIRTDIEHSAIKEHGYLGIWSVKKYVQNHLFSALLLAL